MREALAARSQRDFVSAAPAARRARGTAAKAGAFWRGLIDGARRRPGSMIGGLAVMAAAAAVALNALAFQTKRHPAPLFAPKGGSAAAAVVAPPLPPARPASASAAAPVPTKSPAPSRDPIGDMIRAGNGAAGAARAAEARGDPRPVAAAQRALSRLGYGPLKSDGVMGEGTRQALERFERDRRLAVTRDLSSRTLRELSAQAGVAIE